MTEYAGRSGWNSIIVGTETAVPTPGDRSKLLTNDLRMDTGITNPAYGSTAVTLNFSPPLVNGPGPDLVVFEITRNVSELPDAFQMKVKSTSEFLLDWGPQLSTVSFDWHSRDGGSPVNISELENDAFSEGGNYPESPLHGMAIDLSDFGVSPLEQISTIQFGSFGPDSFDPVLFMGINSTARASRLGDFNADGTVNAADYVVWRNGLGTTYTQADYEVWRTHFGQTVAGTIALSAALPALVPEPSTTALTIFSLSPVLLMVRAHHAGLPGWKPVGKPE
jgi:hypothetical protein